MKTIYTAIFGNYDDLKEPTIVTPGWEYICFTDQPLKSRTWQIIHREMLPEGAQRTARYYKIMFHRHIGTLESMWIDASFQININLDEWWKRFLAPMTCIKHPLRDCFYEEVTACLEQKRDAESLIIKQATTYRVLGLPVRNGLIASGIVMRRMQQNVINLCDLWYQQVQQFSVRDQLAFALASARTPIHHTISWDYQTGQEFIFTRHLHKRRK